MTTEDVLIPKDFPAAIIRLYIRCKDSHKIAHTKRLAFAQDVLALNDWYEHRHKPQNTIFCNTENNIITVTTQLPAVLPDLSACLSIKDSERSTQVETTLAYFRHGMPIRSAATDEQSGIA